MVWLQESERQICLVALAHLRIHRPDRMDSIKRAAVALQGGILYQELLRMHRTRPPVSQDQEEALRWLITGVIQGAAAGGVTLTEDEVRAIILHPDVTEPIALQINALVENKRQSIAAPTNILGD